MLHCCCCCNHVGIGFGGGLRETWLTGAIWSPKCPPRSRQFKLKISCGHYYYFFLSFFFFLWSPHQTFLVTVLLVVCWVSVVLRHYVAGSTIANCPLLCNVGMTSHVQKGVPMWGRVGNSLRGPCRIRHIKNNTGKKVWKKKWGKNTVASHASTNFCFHYSSFVSLCVLYWLSAHSCLSFFFLFKFFFCKLLRACLVRDTVMPVKQLSR